MTWEKDPTKCGHGYRTKQVETEEKGWVVEIAEDCPLCPNKVARGPYGPGTPPGEPVTEPEEPEPVAAVPGEPVPGGEPGDPANMEALAAQEHERRAVWTKKLLEEAVGEFRGQGYRGALEVFEKLVCVKRWRGLMEIPYVSLAEPAKESNREEVRHKLALYLQAAGGPVPAPSDDLTAIRAKLQNALAAVDEMLASEARSREAMEQYHSPQ